MRIGRSVSVLIVVLAGTLASTSVDAQTRGDQARGDQARGDQTRGDQTRGDQQQTRVVKPRDVTVEPERVEPVRVDAVGRDEVSPPDAQTSRTESRARRDRRSAATALREQVDAEIAEARRRTLRFETAFAKVQTDFVEEDPGEQATVPEDVLEGFGDELDDIETRFDAAESGLDALGDAERAQHARDALDALETLQGQLGLLGLRLETRGERARVANALAFDFELLVDSLEALHGPVVTGDRAFDDDIIRPPEGVAPSGELIRPPEGIEPSEEIIRPAQGVAPSRDIIRPPEGVEPSDEIIRPAQGIAPSRQIIRPPEGVEPSGEIIRPPTSDNPAVED